MSIIAFEFFFGYIVPGKAGPILSYARNTLHAIALSSEVVAESDVSVFLLASHRRHEHAIFSYLLKCCVCLNRQHHTHNVWRR